MGKELLGESCTNGETVTVPALKTLGNFGMYIYVYFLLYSCVILCVYIYITFCIYIYTYCSHRDTCITLLFLGRQIVRQNLLGCIGNVQSFVPCQQSTIHSIEFNIGDTATKARCRYHLPHLRFGALLYQHLCTGYLPYLQRSLSHRSSKKLSIQSPSMAPGKSGPPFADVVMDAHLSHFNDGKAH